jgi:hypothetical protein
MICRIVRFLSIVLVLALAMAVHAASWWAVATVGPALEERARIVACERQSIACAVQGDAP